MYDYYWKIQRRIGFLLDAPPKIQTDYDVVIRYFDRYIEYWIYLNQSKPSKTMSILKSICTFEINEVDASKNEFC